MSEIKALEVGKKCTPLSRKANMTNTYEWPGIALYAVHICLLSGHRPKDPLESGHSLDQHSLLNLSGWSQKPAPQVPPDNSDTLRTNDLEGLHNNI